MNLPIVNPDSDAETAEPVEVSAAMNAAGEPAAAPTTEPSSVGPMEVAAEPEPLSIALEELSREMRRVGREVFKANRAAEGNQERFKAALAEIERLTAVVARLPANTAEAVFEAKASLCRELLRVVDAMEASLTAAEALLARLNRQAERPAQGLVFRFAAAREMRAALADAVTALGQWRDGQQLLARRLQLALDAAGVRVIEAMGRQFDPALHRAVSVTRHDDLAAGTIVGEELKGYSLDGRILRYAEVVVAQHE
jgi:molecular chaperone GrpE (heat shock protein)